MPIQSPTIFTSGGAIGIASFVKVDATADQRVIQCGAGDMPIGVAWENTRDPQGVNGADTTHAATAAGQPIPVFVPDGTMCRVKAGTGGFTANDYLKSDASGNAITASTAGDAYGAVALETVTAGELGRVLLRFGRHA